MDDTCNKKCFLWKKYGENCPNYVVGHWKEEGKTFEKRLEDCVPRRTLEELKIIHLLIVGLQKASNQERNASDALAGTLTEAIRAASAGKVVLVRGLDTEKTALPAPDPGGAKVEEAGG